MADYRVTGDVTVDTSAFTRAMTRVQDKLRSVRGEVDSLSRSLDRLGAKSPVVDIEFRGQEKIDRLKEELDSLDTRAIIDANTELANAEIDRLKHKIDSLDKTVRINTVGEGDAGKAASGAEGAAGGGGAMIAAIAGLGPALIPLVGVLAGGIAAVATSVSVLTVGLGSFAAFAVPTIKGVVTKSQELQKVWTEIQNANTPAKLATALQKQKAILDSMDPAQARAVKAFLELEKTYKSLAKTLEPDVFKVFSTGLRAATDLLKPLAGIAHAAAGPINQILQAFDKDIKYGALRDFFDYVKGNIGFFIKTWLQAVGNFVGGILNMLVAFDPLAKGFSSGLLDMSKKFLTWSQHLATNKGFWSFIDFVKKYTPPTLHLLGGLITLIMELSKALAPLGGAVLAGVTKLVDKINEFSKSNPKLAATVATVAALGVAGGLLVTKIPGATAALGPLVELLSSPIGIGVGILGAIAAIAVFADKGPTRIAFFKELKSIWNDLKKTGSQLAHDLKPLWDFFKQSVSPKIVDGLTHMLHTFHELMPIIKPLAELLGALLVSALDTFAYTWAATWEMVDGIVTWLGKYVIKPIAEAFQWLYDKLVGHSIIPDLVNGIVHWFSQLPGRVMSAVLKLPGMLVHLAEDMLHGFLHGIASVVGGVWGWASGFAGNIVRRVGGMGRTLMSHGSDILHGFLGGIGNVAGSVWGFFSGLGNKIIGSVGSLGHTLWNAGTSVIQGLINGIVSMGSSLARAVMDTVVSHIPGPIRRVLGIHSPSRVTTGFGRSIVDGLIVGIQSKRSELGHALHGITQQIAATKIPTLVAAVGVNGSIPSQRTAAGGAHRGQVAAGNIGVYIAPGGVTVNNHHPTDTGGSLNKELTRISRFGQFSGK